MIVSFVVVISIISHGPSRRSAPAFVITFNYIKNVQTTSNDKKPYVSYAKVSQGDVKVVPGVLLDELLQQQQLRTVHVRGEPLRLRQKPPRLINKYIYIYIYI